MVYVPAGTFIFGSNVGDADETPQQIAETESFFIDQYEVSNAEFKTFDPTYTYKSGYDHHAATVTWQQADAFARSLGKRLPTEKEWEKAARGTDGRLYPWGNTYDHTFVAWDETYARGSAPAKPASPYGCYDMAGGAWEWTSDWYQPYQGNDIPSEYYGERYKVMRGGASFNDYAMMRTTHRYYLPTNTTGNYYTGFRCVKDIEKK
jgi:formylglycine-generating enzyme required for sulfatase activity